MLVLRISRRSRSLAPRNAINSPVFYYLGPESRLHGFVCEELLSRAADKQERRRARMAKKGVDVETKKYRYTMGAAAFNQCAGFVGRFVFRFELSESAVRRAGVLRFG